MPYKTTISKIMFALILMVGTKTLTAQSNVKPVDVGESKKPNIIFILTDDLGYGDLGVLFQNMRDKEKGEDHPREYTPNLDRMAAEGALLSQHYSAAPVCAPSRASLLLGRSQGHANMRDNQFDKALDNNHTLGSVLQTAGYTTAAIGKWGLQGKGGKAPNWTAHPLNRGFDYYLGYIRHGDGHEHYPKEGIYRGKKEVYENRVNIAEDLDKCYTTDLFTAAAKRWIVDFKNSEEANTPFFMFLAYDTPHAVLELPTQAYPEGGGLKGGLQWLGEPGHMINTASGKVDSWMHPDYADATYDDDGKPETPHVAWPEVYKRYATDTRRIDDAVGDILQLLKDLKIDKNTMVVFTSDNGPSRESYLANEPIEPTFFKSFGPFDGIKRDCLEGGVRMPTLALWPGNILAGNKIDTPSISYDWMPTFAQMAKLPAPAVSDGVSLLPSLLGKGEQPESTIYIEYYQPGKTPEYSDFIPKHQGRRRNQMQLVRIDDYVGLRYDIKSHNDDFEIYDVVKDPQQTRNLANDPKLAPLQQKMKDKVLGSRIPNSTAIRPYDNALIPASDKEDVQNGVSWKSFKGDFPWVPKVATLDQYEAGVVDRLNGTINGGDDSGAMFFEGYIRVPVDGEYTFYLSANSGALLRIHDAVVVDADYGYFQRSPKSGSIKLKAGLHPFRVFHKSPRKGKPSLKLEWSGPGIVKNAIPEEALFIAKN
ncbi:sulfatase-like hydrolase/transferase [Maribacter polysaccharolyticus]|uniref:sulfatase-like hydrolase/transferase n=1 Tax=Maribacter polysaccharolyticus TaxID=3020831 RepID=UPI00237F7FE1|nr:sulfatase-like hydrolase/transferase [Maribacter polysaccharolyticus]MDE3740981.1 sulfatase-like hydrolase/transferase [Maribacter polysaccharolyticus]